MQNMTGGQTDNQLLQITKIS